MAVERDQEFVEFVAKTLVEKPDAVKVNRTVDEMGVLLELSVDKEDMGVIIGKEGRTAKAIRTLLRVLGAKNDARVNLKVVEPEGSEAPKKEDKKEEPKEDEATEVAEPAEEVKEEVKEETPEPAEDEEEDRPMADLEI
jgi:predicted RNA-binding protein YlqC (UPF0109 family)